MLLKAWNLKTRDWASNYTKQAGKYKTLTTCPRVRPRAVFSSSPQSTFLSQLQLFSSAQATYFSTLPLDVGLLSTPTSQKGQKSSSMKLSILFSVSLADVGESGYCKQAHPSSDAPSLPDSSMLLAKGSQSIFVLCPNENMCHSTKCFIDIKQLVYGMTSHLTSAIKSYWP